MHRMLREQQGLSQAALAQKLGVCQQAVGKWERGTSDPKWALAPQLAVALHCSIDALFGRSPPDDTPAERRENHECQS